MASGLTRQRVPAPTGGIDRRSDPTKIPADKAFDIYNFLTGHPSKLRLRGPLVTLFETTGSPFYAVGAKPVGDHSVYTAIAFNEHALVSGHTSAGTDTLYGRQAVVPNAPNHMFRVNTLTKTIDDLTATLAVAPTPSAVMPSNSFVRLGPRTYARALPTSATASFAYNGVTLYDHALLSWDGSTALPVAYANAPKATIDVESYARRLWTLGGKPPGGGSFEPNTLFFSDPIDDNTALPDTTAAWQDDVTGLTNRIVLDVTDQNDVPVAIVKINAGLAIFKRNSTYLLRGTSPSTFLLTRASASIGCLSAGSVVPYGDGCMFMAEQGFTYFDGSEFTNMSADVEPLIRPEFERQIAGNYTSYYPAIELPNQYILVSTSAGDLLLHVPTRSWVRTNIQTGQLPVLRIGSRAFRVGNDFVSLDYVTNPETADFSALTSGRSFLEDLVAAAGTGITGSVTTRSLELAGYADKAQLHRVVVDHAVVTEVVDGLLMGSFAVFPLGTQNPSALATATIFNDETWLGLPHEYVARGRTVLDVFQEAEAVYVTVSFGRVSYTGTPRGFPVELRDIVVEYTVTRQSRG